MEERIVRVVGLVWTGLNLLLCWSQLMDIRSWGSNLAPSDIFASLSRYLG
jgi:hypothetical protein